MKQAQLAAVIAVATLIVGSALAQGFPGGGGGRQGGMMRWGRMGGGGGSAAFLLQREDVQQDLGLSDAQKDKLKDMQQGMGEKMRAKFMEMGAAGGGRPDRETMQKMMAEVQKEVDKEVNAILDEKQQKRLKEIDLQLAGNSAAMRPEVQKQLELTPQQVEKIKALQQQAQKANASLLEGMRDGSVSREDIGGRMENNQKALNAEIGKVLNEKQMTKLKEMGGKPFVEKKED
jgi:hypothetical protein